MQQDSMEPQAAHVKEHNSSVLHVSRRLKVIDEPGTLKKNAANFAPTPSPSPAPARSDHNMIYGEFSVDQCKDFQMHVIV